MTISSGRALPTFVVGQRVDVRQRAPGQDRQLGEGRIKIISARQIVLEDGSRWRRDSYEWGVKSEGKFSRRRSRWYDRRIVPAKDLVPVASGEPATMHDYDRRAKTADATPGKEGARLRRLAEELNKIEERLREIADEIPFQPEYLKRLPREFHGLYEAKRAVKEIESGAVKVGTVVGILRGGARVIEAYDDPD